MAEPVANVDVCPACDTELEPITSIDRRPERASAGHWLVCPDCDHVSVIALCYYPNIEYEAIWEPADGVCSCGSPATWAVSRNDCDRRDYCDACCPGVFVNLFRSVTIDLDKQT